VIALVCRLHEKPWGRCDVPAHFGAAGQRIGEAWYDHPAAPLPLLVKWLFTSERLSIQVHPDDRLAARRGLASGKEEWWLVTAAEPGATLGIGTRRALDPQALRAAATDGSLEQAMDWTAVRAGDWFHIAPGTVHAIGAGITLVEVQQNADVTYRLYDYGRPRELHLDEGIPASLARPYADPRRGRLPAVAGAGMTALSRCPSFSIDFAAGAGLGQLGSDRVWIIPLSGWIAADGERAGAGTVLYGRLSGRETASPDFTCLAVRQPAG
jgi:mannose-6-phosphate isomerase